MGHYQIADLEKLTGIKSHTIRIWEKRYGIISPHRTSTNIRYYDDIQATKLLKVSTVVELGIKISKIADLSEKELNAKILEAQKTSNVDVICLTYINELIAAMLTFDENGFERAFANAVIKFGIYQAMLKVFYPFLRKTGLMWSMAETMPAQEHFATAIIRKKLISAIDGLPSPVKRSKTFIMFLPPDEWHETGLLFSDYIIRYHGYKTIYLGQNVPVENLDEVVSQVKPSHLFTLYISRKNKEQVEAEVKYLAKNYPKIKLLVAGSPLLLENLSVFKNLVLLHEPGDLRKEL